MTIAQASAKWGVTEKTILEYIQHGYIYGLSIAQVPECNQVILPGIPKPLIKKKPANVKSMDKYILEAMDKDNYVNAAIMGISKEKFKERLLALLKAEAIYSKSNDPDFSSNLDFFLAGQAGGNVDINISADIHPSFNMKPTLNVKLSDQFGVINTNVKLPFGGSDD